MIGAALRTHLLADVGLAALIGTRVHPLILPQGSVFPALTYQQISDLPGHTLGGPVDLHRIRMQIDVWASTYLSMEAVSAALRTALDGYRGQWGGSPPDIVVQGAFLQTERDLYEAEPTVFRRSADYFLWVS